MAATISHDLAWTVTKGHSATLVKRANGVQFSRDPLNLKNLYSRKNEGSIANKVRPHLRIERRESASVDFHE
jgi:large subunit ribosomal protein L28e